jgi:tRNA-2-methylthio-N6-dimethylallyladenosine synthase
MKFHIFTFGCQMNAHDSEWLDRALKARGYEAAPAEEADVLLVNTCSVRDKPEQKVYSLLGRLRPLVKKNPGAFVGVGGCVAQQVGEGFFDRFPFVRLVYGPDGVGMAPQALERLHHEPGLRLSLLEFSETYTERAQALPGAQEQAQAFVNIMQGCNNFCAYCIVPYVRGRQKSRPSTAVLDECRILAERGVREVTLLGQNVNAYGLDPHGDGMGFAELLHRVAAVPGLTRVRFTTSHPKDLAQEVVEAFGTEKTICPQLHLPMQSGSDKVLRAMGRGYDMARYLDLAQRLRRARPDISLTTDLIVGFPGETEEDFQATLSAMETVGFDSSFSFIYCDRPGVRAESMADKVPLEIKSDRLERLQALQNHFTSLALERMVGAKTTILLEGKSKKSNGAPGAWRGRDPHGRVVNVSCSHGGDMSGKMVSVCIMEAKKHSLTGKMEGEPW